MKKINFKSGDRYGRLIVIRDTGLKSRNGKIRIMECKCDCGNITNVLMNGLRNGHTQSCGCLQRESITKHGLTNSRIFAIWAGIKTRCYNKNDHNYKYYGERGIIMCKEWKNDFQAFFDWAMNNGYEWNLTIERIDVNGNYYPENCTWIPMSEQTINQRPNKNNKTGIRGIFFDKRIKRFRVTIGIDNKNIRLGYFKTFQEASNIRREAELKYWGKVYS